MTSGEVSLPPQAIDISINQIDQQFDQINQQFSELNLQYNNKNLVADNKQQNDNVPLYNSYQNNNSGANNFYDPQPQPHTIPSCYPAPATHSAVDSYDNNNQQEIEEEQHHQEPQKSKFCQPEQPSFDYWNQQSSQSEVFF